MQFIRLTASAHRRRRKTTACSCAFALPWSVSVSELYKDPSVDSLRTASYILLPYHPNLVFRVRRQLTTLWVCMK